MIAAIPDYSTFGRATKLRLNPLKILNLGWRWTDDLNTKIIGKVSNVDVIEILEDNIKEWKRLRVCLLTPQIYLKPLREKTKTVNTITQLIVHAEVKVNLAKLKKEGTSHMVWTQFMQEVTGESKEKIKKKYLLD